MLLSDWARAVMVNHFVQRLYALCNCLGVLSKAIFPTSQQGRCSLHRLYMHYTARHCIQSNSILVVSVATLQKAISPAPPARHRTAG